MNNVLSTSTPVSFSTLAFEHAVRGTKSLALKVQHVSFDELAFTQASSALAWRDTTYAALDIECEAAAASRRLESQRDSDPLIASTLAIAESIESEALDAEDERPTLFIERDTVESLPVAA